MVYFKEILPNPAGDDTSGEWIKLVNPGEEDINLSGWVIKDAGGKAYSLTTLAPKNTEIVLPRSLTGIALNNNGDTLYLLSASGETVDSISYTEASDDEIIIASRFVESTRKEKAETTTLEQLALGGDDKIVSEGSFSIVMVAIVIALAASILIGAILKRSEEK
ncbi:MAG: hypothetical protein A3I33_02200 [Candidatus Colwellbacteria bacterium RIFCSPLOWO2_02_FULL_45_11]|uniref:LTD domain-containing protein n=1 Tax=Candidatus Colwellbacteria bacterium RIFCSPLOWO2_02_FULL_45_11 TaxID=1797692 RepID=A0A1G1Z8F3_9BACT|nr:MAG: hypothetical protein A3I33_02200 [Candidatus Colwellbacteria bacterium RIFCSPLOWO2_02_FULL_45_11]